MLPKLNAEPTAYSVTSNINGTLGFAAGTPVVMPSGTRFQIIRSTNSGNAAVGTIVYDGSDLRVNLVMPASRHWYWIRSYVGSNFSPYSPNTFGVLGEPVGWDSTQINSNAIIDSRVSSINFNGGPSTTSGTAVTQTNCLTYTNSLASTVSIYVEHTMLNAGVSWNVSYPSVARSDWQFSTNSSGVSSGSLVAFHPDNLSEAFRNANASFLASLIGGDTIAISLRHQVTHTALAIIGWDGIVSRLTAFKR